MLHLIHQYIYQWLPPIYRAHPIRRQFRAVSYLQLRLKLNLPDLSNYHTLLVIDRYAAIQVQVSYFHLQQ